MDARHMLKTAVALLDALGLEASAALEFEVYIYQADDDSIRANRFRELKALGSDRDCYSVARNPSFEPLAREFLERMAGVGVDVEAFHTELGYGMYEFTLAPKPVLQAADDAFRAKMRQQMNEPYRTLLGHMRHESGHYFFRIVVNGSDLDAARELFGDDRIDYVEALRRHYAGGGNLSWQRDFISSYASAHPYEDWAETWAHYLHICAVTETATTQGLLGDLDEESWPADFVAFTVRLNEVSRSLGLPDAYPFLLNARVVEKLKFVRRMVDNYAASNPP